MKLQDPCYQCFSYQGIMKRHVFNSLVKYLAKNKKDQKNNRKSNKSEYSAETVLMIYTRHCFTIQPENCETIVFKKIMYLLFLFYVLLNQFCI